MANGPGSQTGGQTSRPLGVGRRVAWVQLVQANCRPATPEAADPLVVMCSVSPL